MSDHPVPHEPDEPGSEHPKPADQSPPGDFGGAYGYGHPAHRPDPDARYGFDPKASRVLPIDKRSRWR